MYYNGKLVTQPLYFSSSGGRTENSEDVFSNPYPYLVSVTSTFEDKASHKNEKTVVTFSKVKKALKKDYPNVETGEIKKSNIKILERTAGGRVSEIKLGKGIFSGSQIRTTFGLASALFDIETSKNTLSFISNGSGHGVGMSQYGADGMANEGYNYKEILNHYYSGAIVN